MPVKKKTATKKSTTKKKASSKTTSKKTSTTKKKSPKKTTSTKKKSPSKKKKATSPKKKTTTTKKKASTKKKSTATKKKKTTRKKSSVKKSSQSKVHVSEYVSPMHSIPLVVEDVHLDSSEIDLNDLPSLMDEIEVPRPPEPALAPISLPSRLSFYMGVFFGAIVLHALMISVLAVMSV